MIRTTIARPRPALPSSRILTAARPAVVLWWLVALSSGLSRAAEVDFTTIANEYSGQSRALLKQYCLDCHSTATAEGELDLERFATLADVRRQPRVWVKVAEMLGNGEMPPKDSPQPTPEERQQLRKWVANYLHTEALASAGDPGRVLMRRLNNVEYTNTVRDLTGVPLSPAEEFPVDGAAGEGFTNTGESLVMSPALLTKYLDAAKGIAAHAMLLPDGFRFSPASNDGDWIDELMAGIRGIYGRYSDGDGRAALEPYFEATIAERDAITSGQKTVAQVAAERKLSAKYLAALWGVLTADPTGNAASSDYPGSVIDALRQRWRTAKAEEVAALVALVRPWQTSLWKTNAVGHFKPWHAPVDPVVAQQEMRLKLRAAAESEEVVVYLAAGDAGDGPAGDVVEWQAPRLESGGKPPLPLAAVRRQSDYLLARRREIMGATAQYLDAAIAAQAAGKEVDVAALAAEKMLDPLALAGWLDYLGTVPAGKVTVENHLSGKIANSGGYAFVQGWGTNELPSLVANSSDQEAHIPGLSRPHSVTVHPSPSQQVVVGWLSPVDATMQITAHVMRAHTACGNGITWSLEVRRGSSRRRLASGNSDQLKNPAAGPFDGIQVRAGDLVSLAIGPRDANHACDLTEIDLTLNKTDGEPRQWRLAADVSPDILAGNPHADLFGNKDVWHFYTEPASVDVALAPVIPPDSILARWRDEQDPSRKQQLAADLTHLFTGPRPGAGDEPDKLLYRQATSLVGPVMGAIASATRALTAEQTAALPVPAVENAGRWGIDPALFGKKPDGQSAAPTSLVVQAPSTIEIRLPAELANECDFVVTCALDVNAGREGSVQPHLATTQPAGLSTLAPAMPIVVQTSSQAHGRVAAALAEVRRLFPPAVCYPRIVPVDEVVTLQLLHRDDDPLCTLYLTDDEHAQVDRLWSELRYVSRDAFRLRDAFDQLMEYATQDSDPKLFEPFRQPINDGVDKLRQELLDAEPRQMERAVEFAARAYRRPLPPAEDAELRALYRKLREEELPHDEALRLVLARIFISPAFLYRVEHAEPGNRPVPVSDWELASRLSYFLWATCPDEALLKRAAAGDLHQPDTLVSEARRMLADARARSLATEFACHYLDVHDFEKLDEKSEQHFPEFTKLRGDMYEETVRFFADLFQRDGSVLEVLDADHTFVNGTLAEFYGIPGISGAEWRRVDGVRQYGRGGLLGFSTTLAKHSGASRTSPILRGNWLLEMVLGEKLPKPPKNVPVLPEDETATDGMTVRQLVEKHRSLPQCSTCHAKIDPFGFALEGFDAIGRRREKDLGDRPIDTSTDLPDGQKIDGLAGLRTYLLKDRKEQFLRQFCKKFLGYSLGRGLQLSDQPLVDEMLVQLAKNEYRFSAALETVLRSQQFRYHRALAEVDDAESPDPAE